MLNQQRLIDNRPEIGLTKRRDKKKSSEVVVLDEAKFNVSV
jgi:hypothetical protein